MISSLLSWLLGDRVILLYNKGPQSLKVNMPVIFWRWLIYLKTAVWLYLCFSALLYSSPTLWLMLAPLRLLFPLGWPSWSIMVYHILRCSYPWLFQQAPVFLPQLVIKPIWWLWGQGIIRIEISWRWVYQSFLCTVQLYCWFYCSLHLAKG